MVSLWGILLLVGAHALSTQPPCDDWRLVRLSAEGPAVWVDPETLNSFPMQRINFMDITDTQGLEELAKLPWTQSEFPDVPSQQLIVGQLMPRLNQSSIDGNMQVFTSFLTRYHDSPTGLQSAQWLFDSCMQTIAQTGRPDVSVRTHAFTGSPQPNVIARIEGASANNDVVVIGAHQDSVNSRGGNPATNRSPGADDDASGSITVLEVFRALVLGGFQPQRPIEFQWYAAEEVGLRGSAAIANEYAATGINVHSMMQLDMDGYAPTNPRIALITDFTDPALNAFLRILVDEYLAIPWFNDLCGYACSDHASFTRAGFASSHPFESTFNNAIHTIDDDLNLIDSAYMMHFARLGLAYTVELSSTVLSSPVL